MLADTNMVKVTKTSGVNYGYLYEVIGIDILKTNQEHEFKRRKHSKKKKKNTEILRNVLVEKAHCPPN